MRRTSQCLAMLQLLTSRGLMSRDDLAKELQTNRRNIIEFKKELEDAGYDIQSTSGRYGGYTLKSTNFLPVLTLNAKEKRALLESHEFLKSQTDFLLINDLQKAMDKINIQMDEPQHQGIYLYQRESILSNKMKEFIILCEKARNERHVLCIEYRGMNDSAVHKLYIHPYEILHYHNGSYCFAYSLKAKDFRNFKFSDERMKKLNIEPSTFTRDMNFDIKQHIGKLGLMKDDVHEFELLIYNQQALLIAERRIGIQPYMEWYDANTLYLKTMMEGKLNVISFILSLGDQVDVISPKGLKQELSIIMRNMLKKIEDDVE